MASLFPLSTSLLDDPFFALPTTMRAMLPPSQPTLEGGNVEYRPRADVRETDHGYEVLVELPGVRDEDMNVEVRERNLVVSGECPQPSGESGQYVSLERNYGRFSRSWRLPRDCDPDQIKAELRHGVLRVCIPKTERAQPRRRTIAIQHEGERAQSRPRLEQGATEGQPQQSPGQGAEGQNE